MQQALRTLQNVDSTRSWSTAGPHRHDGVDHYSDRPYSSFGGIPASGKGREFGPEGLVAFQTTQTIYLDQDYD